jgi:hypothetical protein
MQPRELALYPQTRLIGIDEGRSDNGLTNGGHGGFQPLMGFGHDCQNGGVEPGQARQIAHQISRTLGREQVVLGQWDPQIRPAGGYAPRAPSDRLAGSCWAGAATSAWACHHPPTKAA